MRLNKDHPNRAKFEPEQGLDPSLDLALMGADWQLKVQGRARNWQDNIVVSSTRSGEQDALTRMEVLSASSLQHSPVLFVFGVWHIFWRICLYPTMCILRRD